MFITVRSKLLVILLLFVMVTIGMSAFVFNYFQKKKHSVSRITEKIEATHLLLLKDMNVLHNFFENETINPRFFETKKSSLIQRHVKLCADIDLALKEIDALQDANNFELGDSLRMIGDDFYKYKVSTFEIFGEILIRGFKDYGIEGKMRNYAHDLEKFHAELGLFNILQLRRHEKDFIIRQEERYIKEHLELITLVKDNLSSDNSIPSERKTLINKTLNNYSGTFHDLAFYDKRLGLKSGKGLKEKTDLISGKIESSLSGLIGLSAQKTEEALANIRWIYLSLGFVFVVIAIFSAVVISRRISRSITDLKEKIDEFVKSDFTVRTVLPINNSANEIDVLTTNFSIMEQHIVDQMSSLKQSNKDLEMLFYVTSNDIRSPLLKVRELTTAAFIKTNDVGTREDLYKIDKEWEKLINIVDELGIVTNVRSVEVKTEYIDIQEMLQSVFSEFKSLKGFDDIIFTLEIRMQNAFYSSPGLLKAIFRNLIENGIKYAVKRSGISFLKISVLDQNDEMLRIEVEDNGIGIRKEIQDKIFDMFFRGTSYANGIGLGLYIVQCSLEKLDGAIAVESEEGKGTTFTLILPNNYKKKNLKDRIIHNREISSELANS